MSREETYVIRGPEALHEISEESVGKQLHRILKTNEQSKTILIDGATGKKLSSKQLFEDTCRLAEALNNCGLTSRDKIAVCMENSLRYFEPVIAAFYLGWPVVAINNHYTEFELLHALNISEPSVVFCTEKSLEKLLNVRHKTTFIRRIVCFGLKQNVNEVDDRDAFVEEFCDDSLLDPVELSTDESLAVILCSSGTSGPPKGVTVTHGNINAFLANLSDTRVHKFVEGTTFLCFLPFFHVFGFMTVLGNIIKGNKTVVLERFKDHLFLESIQNYKVTHLWLVPPIILFLTKNPMVRKYNLSSINEVVCGAAPLGREIEEEFIKKFNIGRIMQGFGMTETTFAVLLIPFDAPQRVGSCGQVLANLSAKIIDPDSGRALGPHQKGEMCFKGDLLTKGYYRNEEATQNAIDKEGWLRTGDIAYYDDDHYFYIVDRLKELIKYKGFQVAPSELESILLNDPRIKDAAVVGLPDLEAGELPLAFIVKQPNTNLTESEVETLISSKLSRPKHLSGGVCFIEEIPKNTMGKALRRILRDFISKEDYNKTVTN